MPPLTLPANGRPGLETVVGALVMLLTDRAMLPAGPGPAPSLRVVEATERSVGLGQLRGNERRTALPAVSLKGGRLAARVRVELWSDGPTTVATALAGVQERLLAARDALRADGVLELAPVETSLAESLSTGILATAWRQTATYRVLYEYHWADVDGATGLITRVPIASALDLAGGDESTRVTGAAVRWDNETAPALRLRGPARLMRLGALVYFPAAPPAVGVEVLRTHAGAAGPPVDHPSLADFLAAVDVAGAGSRHDRVVFPRLEPPPGPPAEAFLAAFTATGDQVALGNWERALDPSSPDDAPDLYSVLSLELAPALVLPSRADRLEIICQAASFPATPVAALYLRGESG